MEVDQILGRIERVAILRITLDRIRHSNHAHARRPRLHKSQAEGGRCKGEEKPGTQHPQGRRRWSRGPERSRGRACARPPHPCELVIVWLTGFDECHRAPAGTGAVTPFSVALARAMLQLFATSATPTALDGDAWQGVPSSAAGSRLVRLGQPNFVDSARELFHEHLDEFLPLCITIAALEPLQTPLEMRA